MDTEGRICTIATTSLLCKRSWLGKMLVDHAHGERDHMRRLAGAGFLLAVILGVTGGQERPDHTGAISSILAAVPFDSVCGRACAVAVVERSVWKQQFYLGGPRGVGDSVLETLDFALGQVLTRKGHVSVVVGAFIPRALGPDTVGVRFFFPGGIGHDSIEVRFELLGNVPYGIGRAILLRTATGWVGRYLGIDYA
jgi:hypothetical protein